jgi:hypothetical protein
MAVLDAVPNTLVGLMLAAVPPPPDTVAEFVLYLMLSALVVALFALTVAFKVAEVEVTLDAGFVVTVGAVAAVPVVLKDCTNPVLS